MFYIVCFPLEAQQMENNSSRFQRSLIHFASNSNRKKQEQNHRHLTQTSPENDSFDIVSLVRNIITNKKSDETFQSFRNFHINFFT